MPLDRKRIQGFGCSDDVVRCPGGHTLQAREALEGSCDVCRRGVKNGEPVMDCRRCNFYVCEQCQVAYKAPSSGFWGAVSSLVGSATEELSELVNDLSALVSQPLDGGPAGEAAPAPKVEDSWHLHYQKAECSQIMAEFCDSYSEARVVPKEDELEALWSRFIILYSCALHPAPMANAIGEQLARAGGEEEGPWQPRLRALYALGYLVGKGEVGAEIARAALAADGGSVEELARVPGCAEKAREVFFALTGEQLEGGTAGYA